MKGNCVKSCFIKLNAKVSPKSSGEGGDFSVQVVRYLLLKLIFAQLWKSKTQDYHQKLNVRVASRISEQFKT